VRTAGDASIKKNNTFDPISEDKPFYDKDQGEEALFPKYIYCLEK